MILVHLVSREIPVERESLVLLVPKVPLAPPVRKANVVQLEKWA